LPTLGEGGPRHGAGVTSEDKPSVEPESRAAPENCRHELWAVAVTAAVCGAVAAVAAVRVMER
jgi:hypothetical protein